MRALEIIIHVGIKHHRWGENYNFSPVLHIFSETFGSLIFGLLLVGYISSPLLFALLYWCDLTVLVCSHLAYIHIVFNCGEPCEIWTYITVLVFAHYYAFGIIVWIRGRSSLDADYHYRKWKFCVSLSLISTDGNQLCTNKWRRRCLRLLYYTGTHFAIICVLKSTKLETGQCASMNIV